VARAVDLMPPMESIPDHLDFAGVCIPAWQVGGDFYDVFADKHGRIGLMLTDVAGKGLPAALLSMPIQGPQLGAAVAGVDVQMKPGLAPIPVPGSTPFQKDGQPIPRRDRRPQGRD
jgi:hypothetical protein